MQIYADHLLYKTNYKRHREIYLLIHFLYLMRYAGFVKLLPSSANLYASDPDDCDTVESLLCALPSSLRLPLIESWLYSFFFSSFDHYYIFLEIQCFPSRK